MELEELTSLALMGLAQAREAWGRYCEKHGYDPYRTEYFGAYCSRRMNGSILDAMRALDWVTRPVRERARALRDAGEGLGKSEIQLAQTTGMSRDEVHDTTAEMARRPVTFDASEHDMADAAPLADVEGGAVVADILRQSSAVLRSMPPDNQLAAVLVFYCGMSAAQSAEAMGLPVPRVQSLADAAALAVHRALASAMSG